MKNLTFIDYLVALLGVIFITLTILTPTRVIADEVVLVNEKITPDWSCPKYMLAPPVGERLISKCGYI